MYINEPIAFHTVETENYSNVIGTFTIPKGFYDSIDQFLKVINNAITADVGTFIKNENNISFKSKGSTGSVVSSVTLRIGSRLKRLLDGFKYTQQGNYFYLQVTPNSNPVIQDFVTIERFYNRKAIRVYVNELNQAQFIENDNVTGYHGSNLLISVPIYNDVKRSFNPTHLQTHKLLGDSRIYSIAMHVSVEYMDGSEFPLTISPQSYFGIQLLFANV
jgi:hypothetical protein